MSVPTIGITPTRKGNATNGYSIGTSEAMVDSVLKAGGIPLILPYTNDEVLLERAVARVDAVLIPGGEDIDPATYGKTLDPHVDHSLIDHVRDNLELRVSTLALFSIKKPILGICRGLQVMNVAAGGTLVTDIPAHRQSDMHGWQGKKSWEKIRHTIEITVGSRLHSILNCSELSVNSIHHQAVDVIGRGLIVNAVSSEDHIIEGLELPNHPFAIGVQSHPETLWQRTEPVWIRLFESLVHAATAQSA